MYGLKGILDIPQFGIASKNIKSCDFYLKANLRKKRDLFVSNENSLCRELTFVHGISLNC